MAGKNDPSIYDDRSTIGSSDELDEYGVWVKSEPQDLSASLPDMDDLPGFEDFNESAFDTPAPVLPDSDTEESVDDGLEFEEVAENSELPDGLSPAPIDKDGFTEVSMDDFIDSESPGIDFGDLDTTVPEIVDTEDFEKAPAPGAEPAGGTASREASSPDLSTQLLMKIADELSSIRTELSSLKKELASVKTGEAKAEPDDAAGFFDEEDDEKIALTGDELENILNTANFTEEAGSDQGESISDFDLDTETDTPAAPETAPQVVNEESLFTEEETVMGDDESIELDIEDVQLAEFDEKGESPAGDNIISDDFDVSLDLDNLEEDGALPDFNEPSELSNLREVGAEPLTPPPEDTSYLEEDPLAPPDIDDISGGFDLSGAVIDEPDLSASISENPVTEPAIDNISIDLDMEESAGQETTADDFSFETEETIEIPVSDAQPAIDDGFPISEDFAAAPETGNYDFTATMPPAEETPPPSAAEEDGIPGNLKQELKTVLSYMDQLLESLPEDKIEEFAKSEYFDTYKKLFEELGLV
ncbi:MAG: hypothetical protein LBB82_02760 [Treponema sp.]|jgi:hypothetical protein|nr:hypothetical protein [Treponema sp.]